MSRISGGMIGARNIRIMNDAAMEARAAQQGAGTLTGTNTGTIGVSHGPGGLNVDQDSFRAMGFNVPVVIVSSGPNGETYTDERYWAREVYVLKTDAVPGGPVQMWIKGTGFWAPVYNVTETAAGTHTLHEFNAGTAKDDVQVTDKAAVIVLAQQGDGLANDPSASEYVFSFYGGGGNGGISFLITSNTSTAWEYNAKTKNPDDTLSSSADLIVRNLAEKNLSDVDHHLTSTDNPNNIFSLYGVGRIVSTDVASGKPIVETTMYWTSCAPPTTGDGTYAPPATITVSNGFVTSASE